MSDKIWKKARIFLDEKQKMKIRLPALLHFIDYATEQDQFNFFRENQEILIQFTLDNFNQTLTKIQSRML